jgi:hypothetical protein
MSEVENIAAALVSNIQTRFPQYLGAPFSVREVLEQIIPYRLCRNELGMDNSEEYELAVARLIAGEGGYINAPPEVTAKLRAAIDNPFPDAAALRVFQAVSVSLGSNALSARHTGPLQAARPPAQVGRSNTPTVATKENRMPPGQRTTNAAALGGKCRYCHGVLPDGREITYCPHCGQDLTVHHCPACSSELQVGWKFCVTCGRSVE